MKISVRSIAFFPLRAIGLDPGRALINAHPSEADKNRDRVEMRRYVVGAIAARGGDGESPSAPRDRLSRRRSS
jgi:hypothetical protein